MNGARCAVCPHTFLGTRSLFVLGLDWDMDGEGLQC
jgi:hypothetical protein